MFRLPALPYGYDALAPTISETTLRTHHARHHARYVETTNALLRARGGPPATLEAVLRDADADADRKLFNNAGQVWNHAFFWSCMDPVRSRPPSALLGAIEDLFGDLAGLRDSFIAEGVGHFGSGWVWLVAEGRALSVRTTHDGDSMAIRPETPLLVCDLWEHAYYLDHKNDRAGFLAAWWDNLVDWIFVAQQFYAARGKRAAWTFADAEQSMPVSV